MDDTTNPGTGNSPDRDNPGQDARLSESAWKVVDAAIVRLEEAWRQGTAPDLGTFVPADLDSASQRNLLFPLIGIDLEWRWKTAAETGSEAGRGKSDALPRRPRLSDYATRYPLLGPVERFPVDVLVNEYYARRRYGDQPTHDEYVEPFGPFRAEVLRRLEDIDDEIARGAQRSLAPGAVVEYFGDYQLLERIGKGGMGVVYRARQVSLNRLVAVKMVLAGHLADEESVRRFRAEAEAVANLDHPGIVRIIEIGEHQGCHYFSMDLVEGESLESRLKENPLAPREAARFIEQAARAVAYANSHGVVHRDLTPANILVDREGQVRVTDFGLAKRMQGDGSLTASGAVLGTPGYMPPEQAEGCLDHVSARSDVYSLGATLYALLVGRPPFLAATPLEMLLQVRGQEPTPLRKLRRGLPADLELICTKCLEKDPQRRYASAEELAEDLRRFVAGEPILARTDCIAHYEWRIATRYTSVLMLPCVLASWFLLTNFIALMYYGARIDFLAPLVLPENEGTLVRRNQETIGFVVRIRQAASAEKSPGRVAVMAIMERGYPLRRGETCRLVVPESGHAFLDFTCPEDPSPKSPVGRVVATSIDISFLGCDTSRMDINAAEGDVDLLMEASPRPVCRAAAWEGGGFSFAAAIIGSLIFATFLDAGVLHVASLFFAAVVWQTRFLVGSRNWYRRVPELPRPRYRQALWTMLPIYAVYSLLSLAYVAWGPPPGVGLWNSSWVLIGIYAHTLVVAILFHTLQRGGWFRTIRVVAMYFCCQFGALVTLVFVAPVMAPHQPGTWDFSYTDVFGYILAQKETTDRGRGSLPSRPKVTEQSSAVERPVSPPLPALLKVRPDPRQWTLKPDVPEPRAGSWRPGMPLNPAALVVRPAAIKGLRAWTIETRGSRNDWSCGAGQLSPDGQWYAAAGHDGVVRFLDPATGKLRLALVNPELDLAALCWSPDSERVAVGSNAGPVRIWDVRKGELVVGLTSSSANPITALAWSPDGAVLAIGSRWAPRVVLWDVRETGQTAVVRAKADEDRSSVNFLAWSPDGKQLMVTTDSAVRVWDVAARKLILTLSSQDAKDRVQRRAAAWSPDGKRIAVLCGDRKLSFFDSACNLTATRKVEHQAHADPPCLAWSPKGGYLAVTSFNSCEVVNTANGLGAFEITGLEWGDGCLGLSWSDNVQLLCMHRWSGSVTAVCVGDKVPLWRVFGKLRFDGYDTDVVTSPDGKQYATAVSKGHLCAWNAVDGYPIRDFGPISNGHGQVAWSDDGHVAMAGGHWWLHNDCGGYLWEPAKTGKPIRFRDGGDRCAAWSPDGKTFARGGKGVLLWTAGSAAPCQVFRPYGDAEVARLAWDVRNPSLVAGLSDGKLAVLEMPSGKMLRSLRRDGLTGEISFLTVLPDGRRIAASQNGAVSVWNSAWESVGELLQLGAAIRDGTMPREGMTIALATSCGIVLLDLDKPTARRSIGTEPVYSVAWSTPLHQLIAAQGDRLAFYDDRTGELLAFHVPWRDPGKHLFLSPEGHLRCSPAMIDDLVYVALIDDGRQLTLRPDEFAAKYGWKNDPQKVRLCSVEATDLPRDSKPTQSHVNVARQGMQSPTTPKRTERRGVTRTTLGWRVE